MARIRARRRIVRWGNAYGIRLTAGDLRRLGARVRDEVDVEVRTGQRPVDLGHLTPLSLGGDASRHHDEIVGEGLARETGGRGIDR